MGSRGSRPRRPLSARRVRPGEGQDGAGTARRARSSAPSAITRRATWGTTREAARRPARRPAGRPAGRTVPRLQLVAVRLLARRPIAPLVLTHGWSAFTREGAFFTWEGTALTLRAIPPRPLWWT